MISRTVLVKVGVFALITLLGIGYTLYRYLGVGTSLFVPTYDVAVDLADSGGIFPTAEVTYRGVGVGRVGDIALREGGIRVTLELQTDERIPADLRAVVANGAAVGEQYVDLQPRGEGGPYLEDGSVVPQSATALPVGTNQLLQELDDLVNSVPRDDLTTVVREAGLAFAGRGDDLQQLLDSGGALVAEARAALPETSRLLVDGERVLATQREQGTAITSFSRDLALLTEQLRTNDPQLRTILRDGVPAAQQLRGLVDDVAPSFGPLLADLVGVGTVLDQRENNLRQLLIYYPYLVSASLEAFPGDNTARFAVPLNQAGPPACTEGYLPPEQWLDPNEGTDQVRPFPFGAHCKAPPESGIAPRGHRNSPQGGAKK